jgi:hypothetical protein
LLGNALYTQSEKSDEEYLDEECSAMNEDFENEYVETSA